MKRLIILLIYLLIPLSGCAGWTYNGIRGEDLKNFNADRLAGGIVSFATHIIGHHLSAKLMGYNTCQRGLSEIVYGYDEMTDKEKFIFGASGFGLQLLVGYGMKWSGLDNDFAKGYNTMAMMEAVLYPITDNFNGEGSDIDAMDSYMDGDLAWGLFIMGTVGLNYKRDK